jgi:uncharacterized metal-binding protein YceD (DUF177 family)
MSPRRAPAAGDGPHIPDATIRLDSMPPEGRTLTVEPDAELRAEIAAALGVTALDRLRVELRATRFRGGMRVEGRLLADVEQPCVVTLAPVHQSIEEPVDRVFLPAEKRGRQPAPAAELLVDVEGEDLPDVFEGHEADLSDMIVETLALAIDPYPRAPGATLDDLGVPAGEDDDPSPFAGLASLRDKGG